MSSSSSSSSSQCQNDRPFKSTCVGRTKAVRSEHEENTVLSIFTCCIHTHHRLTLIRSHVDTHQAKCFWMCDKSEKCVIRPCSVRPGLPKPCATTSEFVFCMLRCDWTEGTGLTVGAVAVLVAIYANIGSTGSLKQEETGSSEIMFEAPG